MSNYWQPNVNNYDYQRGLNASHQLGQSHSLDTYNIGQEHLLHENNAQYHLQHGTSQPSNLKFAEPEPCLPSVENYKNNRFRLLDDQPTLVGENLRYSPRPSDFSNTPKFFLSTQMPNYPQNNAVSQSSLHTNHPSLKNTFCGETFDYLENKSESNLSQNLKSDSFVITWLKYIENKCITKDRPKVSTIQAPLKISNFQKAFSETTEIIHELENVYSSLSTSITLDSEFYCLIQKAEELKLLLEKYKSFIGDAKNIQILKELIQLRRDKRRRAKIKKAQRNAKFLCLKEQWKEKEKKIDQWQKQMHDHQNAVLQDKNMKKSADTILHDVRAKQEEAFEIRNLVGALCQLRETRLKKGEIHGFVSTMENTRTFENMAGELQSLIDSQLTQYNLEEQTLRVMMENPPNLLPQKLKILNNSIRNLEENKQNIYEYMFGKRFSPISELEKRILDSEKSIETLIKIRTSWDMYIAKDDSPVELSTSIPVGFVLPPTEPALQWRKYLVNK